MKPAGDPNALYQSKFHFKKTTNPLTPVLQIEIKMPESFLAKSKNPTINMLEHMIFNLDQLQVGNYVKREPKYLFKVQKNRFQSGKSNAN